MNKIVVNGKVMELPSGSINFTVDETLKMSEENVLGVAVPTRGVTKEEFDRMSDEEKKGHIIVTDETVPDNIDSYGIFSTNEVRVGTWIDGKPIYRRAYQLIIPTFTIATDVKNFTVEYIQNVDMVTRLDGRVLRVNTKQFQLIPSYGYDSVSKTLYKEISISYNASAQNLIYSIIPYSSLMVERYSGGTLCITIEYTKTTD